NVKLDMHHVRKLKNLQGKEDWEKTHDCKETQDYRTMS
ncbi:hypothetical protein BSBG_05036, partial [Bacteroides sp. 9_1_42FAA]